MPEVNRKFKSWSPPWAPKFWINLGLVISPPTKFPKCFFFFVHDFLSEFLGGLHSRKNNVRKHRFFSNGWTLEIRSNSIPLNMSTFLGITSWNFSGFFRRVAFSCPSQPYKVPSCGSQFNQSRWAYSTVSGILLWPQGSRHGIVAESKVRVMCACLVGGFKWFLSIFTIIHLEMIRFDEFVCSKGLKVETTN